MKSSTAATGSLRPIYRYICKQINWKALVNGIASIHSGDIYQSCTEISICTHNTTPTNCSNKLLLHCPNPSQILPETGLYLHVRIKEQELPNRTHKVHCPAAKASSSTHLTISLLLLYFVLSLRRTYCLGTESVYVKRVRYKHQISAS